MMRGLLSRCLSFISSTEKSESKSKSKSQGSPSCLMADPPPMEIICDILLRLPVKDLLRYKSVSRAWYDLITSPNFIKLHLNRTLLESEAGAGSRSVPGRESDQTLILSNLNSLQVVDFRTLSRTQKLDLPPGFSSANSATLLIGSCHGLVCLCSRSRWDAALYNPSTRAHRVIKWTPVQPIPLSVTFGFGYDPRGDDYKVVRIEDYLLQASSGEVYTREIMVYSMRSNSWKLLTHEQSPDDVIDSHGALANDRLHWLSIERGDERKGRIVCFDLAEERFGEVPIPPYYGKMVHYPKDVGVVSGKLCFLTEANSEGWIRYIDVWTMNEYGVGKTWFRLYSVWCLRCLATVAYLTASQMVLVSEAGKVFWYNRSEQKKAHAEIRGAEEFSEATLCLSSLVSVY